MFIDNLRHDVRYAVRSYAKAPSFTLVILMTLALGIGASTAIFSLVNGILLQPLPLPDPGRLVYANEVNGKGDRISVSWSNFLDWRARARSFESLSLSREQSYTLTGTERAQRVRGRQVTGNFFHVLGVSAASGRGLTDDDDRPAAVPAAIVSDAYWRTQLGADPAVIGRTLRLDGVEHTIVGVMPRNFQYVRPYDLFTSTGPIASNPTLLDRGNHNDFYALGRLKPGVSLKAAASELKTIAAALEREYP
jgi:putative ABC transport system permease protein